MTKETVILDLNLRNLFLVLATTIIGIITPFTLLTLRLICIGTGDQFSVIQNNIPNDIAYTTIVLGILSGGYVWLRFWKDITETEYND